MKELLQSKHFKKKIGKWLIMYAVFMMFFTTVITYSKYISKLMDSSDEARVSKFNVQLKYCDNNTNDAIKYRPTKEIVYCFKTDTTNIEVNTDVYYTIKVDDHFKIKEIKKIYTGAEEVSSIDSKIASIKEEVTAGNGKETIYEVVVIYDESKLSTDSEGNKMYKFDESITYKILTIGYSATQTR